MRITDIEGQRFGSLTVVSHAGSNRNRRATWLCSCDCGGTAVVTGTGLRMGVIRTCGHSHRAAGGHAARKSPEYSSWQSMRARCGSPSTANYQCYGGRGILVCERWRVFANFLTDMGPRPKGTSLDRINNDGNYEPGNCRWATNAQQHRNTRANRVITANGETLTLADWALRTGLGAPSLTRRLDVLGWSPERTMGTPADPTKTVRYARVEHGRVSTYKHRGCRCEPCRLASSAEHRAWRMVKAGVR